MNKAHIWKTYIFEAIKDIKFSFPPYVYLK